MVSKPEMTPDLKEKFKMIVGCVYHNLEDFYMVGIINVSYLTEEEVFLVSVAGLSQKSPIDYKTYDLQINNGEIISAEDMPKLVREYEKARIRLSERPKIELPFEEIMKIEESLKKDDESVENDVNPYSSGHYD